MSASTVAFNTNSLDMDMTTVPEFLSKYEPRIMKKLVVEASGPVQSEAQLDANIKHMADMLRLARDYMTNMANQRPINKTELADVVEVTRHIGASMMFRIRRFHDEVEEGLRLEQEQMSGAAAVVAAQERTRGCYLGASFRCAAAMRSRLQLRGLASRREKRLDKIQDAMDKVEKHSLLTLMAEGSVAPY